MKILLLENVNANVINLLETDYSNVSITHLNTSLSEIQLIEQLPNYDIVGIRSRTNLTKHVIENNKHLVAICCFCIGTNQVDLETATKYNIPVFNSPYMNTRSVAELVMSHIIALARQTYVRNTEMHNQFWNKTSKNCYEVRGKKLGIIGYGHVGSQVGTLAEMIGMEVLFYDIAPVLARGNSKSMDSLTHLLTNSDFVSIHVPLSDETYNLFGENEFKLMQAGSYLINTSRGTVVDLDSLATYIENGHLSGAAIDVYPKEPNGNGCHWEHPLQKYNNVILTPHIGGATEEAQGQIGLDIGYKIINYIKYGSTVGCVNMPEIISGEKFKNGGQIIINFHNNVPGYLSKINKIFEEENVNIDKQILSTHNETAYLLIKISKKYDKYITIRLVNKISNLDTNSRTYLND
jgi:D-3-phosphoglycerate dehydrogenase / 2-oxoglutarate reductase